MTPPASIESLLHAFDNDPMPPAQRWDIGKRAERLAEEAGNQQQLYAIRMRLVGFAHEVVDAEAQLSLFLWCAYTHDSDPQRFPTKPVPEQPEIDLLWWYKWLVGMLFAFPQYSLEQIRSALDMMRAAYKREGAGNAGVLWSELMYLMEVGSNEEIRDQLATLHITEVDDYSDCEACSRAVEASARWKLHDDTEALALFDQILVNNYNCSEEPESIMAEALIPLLEAGRIEQAIQLQQVSYPRIMRSPAHIGLQAEHMLFFLITENPAKAYELLARHVDNLWHQGLSPAGQLGGLLRIIRVASLIEKIGHGNLPLPSTHTKEARLWLGLAPHAETSPEIPVRADSARWPLTVSEFLPLARTKARTLAERFDSRNQHTRSADSLQRAELPFDKTYPIDLGGREFPEDEREQHRYLIEAFPPENGSSRDWLELALHMLYVLPFEHSTRALHNALEVASTDTERENALVLALQHDKFEPFAETLTEYIQLKRSQGLTELANKLEEYDWPLWRSEQPAGSGAEHKLPLLDIATELRTAQSPDWRAELALLLIEQAAASTSSLFEDWEKSAPAQIEHAAAEWDRMNGEWVNVTLRLPAGDRYSHAQSLHEEVGKYLDRKELPPWGLLMSYAIRQAQISLHPGTLLEVLRCGNDYFTAVPPHLNSVVQLLEFQAEVAKSEECTASEIMALSGLTRIAARSGSESDPRWGNRLLELAGSARHPYLAAKLYIDGAQAASDTGEIDESIRLLKKALANFDAAAPWRDAMDIAERTFMTRSAILELLLREQYAEGPTIDAYTTSSQLVFELENEQDAPGRTERLMSAYAHSADITLASGIGDLYEVRNRLEKGLELYPKLRKTHDEDERALILTNLLLPYTHTLLYFDEVDSALIQAQRTLDSLVNLTDHWSFEVATRLQRLAMVTAHHLPEVSQRALSVLTQMSAWPVGGHEEL